MRFSTMAIALLMGTASAAVIESRQNDNRPVPQGGCCVANTSLKQDVCSVNGQSGRCVPDSINNCGERLTCIPDAQLTCDANRIERGRPFCRRTGTNFP
ncbi:hypothetical protein S40285_09148 [Stachybotrys chlorohalonatus IBT 40285]|uniref:Uncharacterized protein n=1 Tax=Stachybotrys chlorohalonatus (strain IBT 40285) TaxID=1283841 RepID=A0A084QXR3_STAC4|nr:hypothetical protein S40285_09148 [Stachybotrys chlorohalonata IBT 40285]